MPFPAFRTPVVWTAGPLRSGVSVRLLVNCPRGLPLRELPLRRFEPVRCWSADRVWRPQMGSIQPAGRPASHFRRHRGSATAVQNNRPSAVQWRPLPARRGKCDSPAEPFGLLRTECDCECCGEVAAGRRCGRLIQILRNRPARYFQFWIVIGRMMGIGGTMQTSPASCCPLLNRDRNDRRLDVNDLTRMTRIRTNGDLRPTTVGEQRVLPQN